MCFVGDRGEDLAVEGKADRCSFKYRQESIEKSNSIPNTMSLSIPNDAGHNADLRIFRMFEEGADVVCRFEDTESRSAQLIDV